MTGFELRLLREGQGISRSEAARLLQISEAALRRFEKRTTPIPLQLASDSAAKLRRKEAQ
jgi:DNA-binding transcriptional regulator YiaG